jgi:hypothetical protein
MVKPEANDDTKDDGPSETDLVIRDGFPALRLPGTNWKPKVAGEDPIPRHSFWSMENAIEIDPMILPTLLEDCETVFTARDKPDGAAYSAGQTYFLPANMKPRCALEALAQSIFQKHTEHLEEGSFIREQSGANWWTLVLESDDETGGRAGQSSGSSEGFDEAEFGEDEVGLHFDADYELEEQTTNLLLHPRVATVTYLSGYGAPTLILDQKSPPMDDVKKSTLEKGIEKGWLSHPRLGKHTAFDGRLLHGAPALYFPGQTGGRGDGDEPVAKKVKADKKRYTLLVNVWLNHWVMDAGLLDDEVCAKLKTPWKMPDSNQKGDSGYKPPFKWNSVDLSLPSTGIKTVILTPATENKGEPAGEDDLTLCNHTVTIKYNSTMEECRKASAAATTVELTLARGAITLHVGDELPEASDGEEDE